MLIAVPVTIRSHDVDVPPCEVTGYAPHEACALAVTPAAHWNYATQEWRTLPSWCITHRPSGFRLPGVEWSTAEAAGAVLRVADPDFPAWPLATGAAGCVATVACKAKLRAALESGT